MTDTDDVDQREQMRRVIQGAVAGAIVMMTVLVWAITTGNYNATTNYGSMGAAVVVGVVYYYARPMF